MAQLAPIQLEDGTTIYIEADSQIVSPVSTTRGGRVSKGVGEPITQRFQEMQSTIRAYTAYTLNAFRSVSAANVDKVTLEFGITVAGEAGIPYVTKGSAESNLKITVECSFKD